jgi:hypothetical protein
MLYYYRIFINLVIQRCKKKLWYIVTSILVLAFLLTSTTLILKTTGNSSSYENTDEITTTTPLRIYQQSTFLETTTTKKPRRRKKTTTTISTTTTTIAEFPDFFEGSADDSDFFTDDEDLEFESVPNRTTRPVSTTRLVSTTQKPKKTSVVIQHTSILDEILGNWRQVKTIGLEEYLVAEGGGWFFRKMAASVSPDLEIQKISKK